MRRLVMLFPLAIAVASTSGGCVQGCAQMGLTGVLTERAGELVLTRSTLGSTPVHVDWPDGYVVRRDGDTLVLVDPSGNIGAREGQTILLGGTGGTRGKPVVS